MPSEQCRSRETDMKARYAYTDTFGGEANYSWVRRGTVEAETELGCIRKAKAAVGLNGVPCKRSEYGDVIDLRPHGCCTVLSIDFDVYEPERVSPGSPGDAVEVR